MVTLLAKIRKIFFLVIGEIYSFEFNFCTLN